MELRSGRWRIRMAIILALIVVCSVAFHFLYSRANETAPAGRAGAATGDGAKNTNPVANAAALPASPAFTLTMKQFPDSEMQALLPLPAQQQAEQMMRAAVNHFDGATDLIKGYNP